MFEPFAPQKRKRTLTGADKKRIAASQGFKCKKCGKPFGIGGYHIDHIRRVDDKGSDRESNLQALCPNCHAEKTENERHKKKQAKIREHETQGGGLSGGSDLFGAPSKPSRSSGSMFELGSSKPRKSKPLQPVFGIGPAPKRRKKNIWEL
jgi:hypothetical protein